MIGIYFSGTGNTKYCVEKFLREYDEDSAAFSIEEKDVILEIQNHKRIVFGYPTQYSNIPKLLSDFIMNHGFLWKEKEVFIIVTMGLFCGDGSGILARLFEKFGAKTIGGLHLKMPDSICDEKVLKRTLEQNRRLIAKADRKIEEVAKNFNTVVPKEGLGPVSLIIGLFGQRLYFYNKTKNYSDKLKIDCDNCVGCGLCVSLCPTKNIVLLSKKACASNKCTLCYRCVNRCPQKAITLLGKKVIQQSCIEKYAGPANI